jgi:hypothetical protein
LPDEHGDAMNLDDDDTVDELPPRPRQVIPTADRDLLELAARALGAVRVEDVDGEEWVNLHFADGSTVFHWNPLLFYGDTFELAVRLSAREGGIAIMLNSRFDQTGFAQVHTDERHKSGHAYMGDDPLQGAARAVVRAAAEIGKQHS